MDPGRPIRPRFALTRRRVRVSGTQAVVTPGTLIWDSLSEEQKRHHARRMEVYAGMVDAMDLHIGRLMDYLESMRKSHAGNDYDDPSFEPLDKWDAFRLR